MEATCHKLRLIARPSFARTKRQRGCVHLEKVERAIEMKALALLMGKHERVGKDSPVRFLVDDLLGEVLYHYFGSYHNHAELRHGDEVPS